MGERHRDLDVSVCEKEEEEEEAQAQVDIYKYIFGFAELAVVKCAIDLGIAETIENHKKPITLLELSSTLNCDPSYLNRIMRFLVHKKIFKTIPSKNDHSPPSYIQTPLSRRLMKNGEHSMAALFLLGISPVMLVPSLSLSDRVLVNGNSSFEKVHGEDVWSYIEQNLDHCNLFNDGMACDAKVVVPAIVEGCSEVFDGIKSLVDVGGGNGNTMSTIVKACPWIHGINFDLPHVVAMAPKTDVVEHVAGDMFKNVPKADAVFLKSDVVEHVAGDMFKNVPKADAVFLKWVLHDWGDEECIQILKKCREAIPKEKGRVIIVESVIEEGEKQENKFKEIGLLLDMIMMAHTKCGKERTMKEWEYVIKMAGFTSYTIKSINAVQSVILASF